MNNDARVSFVWKLLRYSYGAVILLAGLDKVLNTDLIVNWEKYTSPFVASLLPFSNHTFVVMIGVIEVIVAILIFTKWTTLASYIASLWLVLIAINLLMTGGYVDIAIRDILLAVGAYSLAQLGVVHGYTASGKRM